MSFRLPAGELVLIEGDNGAGKTTLARSLLGLHRHYRGSIERHLGLEDVAYLPQLGNVQFFLPLTLRDVIELKGPRRAEDIVAVGLLREEILNRPWNSASGDERQRALLTRVFLSGARLLILDEPFNHLDQETRGRVTEALASRLAAGTAILMISHQPALGGLDPTHRLFLKGKT